MKKILVVTDNGILYRSIKDILENEFPDLLPLFDFKRSRLSSEKKMYADGIDALPEVDMKTDFPLILQNYDLVISLHCKQIFPTELVNNKLCINIHPGYNPYNRGWYPQAFAIINKMKLGATIHIMDEKVDHGAIIDRQEVEIESWYTSKEAYEKILETELQLFRKNIEKIVSKNFITIEPELEGNYHSIGDYRKLCKLDLHEILTMAEAIDKLRALSHGVYKNSYFYDNEGNKIFVKLELSKDNI